MQAERIASTIMEIRKDVALAVQQLNYLVFNSNSELHCLTAKCFYVETSAISVFYKFFLNNFDFIFIVVKSFNK